MQDRLREVRYDQIAMVEFLMKKTWKKTVKHSSKYFSWFYDFFRPPKLSPFIVIHLNLYIEVGTEMIRVDYISQCYYASGSSKSRKEWRRQIEDEVGPGIKSSLNSSAIHVAAAAQSISLLLKASQVEKVKKRPNSYFWRLFLVIQWNKYQMGM